MNTNWQSVALICVCASVAFGAVRPATDKDVQRTRRSYDNDCDTNFPRFPPPPPFYPPPPPFYPPPPPPPPPGPWHQRHWDNENHSNRNQPDIIILQASSSATANAANSRNADERTTGNYAVESSHIGAANSVASAGAVSAAFASSNQETYQEQQVTQSQHQLSSQGQEEQVSQYQPQVVQSEQQNHQADIAGPQTSGGSGCSACSGRKENIGNVAISNAQTNTGPALAISSSG